jgi:hypothetical protein
MDLIITSRASELRRSSFSLLGHTLVFGGWSWMYIRYPVVTLVDIHGVYHFICLAVLPFRAQRETIFALFYDTNLTSISTSWG